MDAADWDAVETAIGRLETGLDRCPGRVSAPFPRRAAARMTWSAPRSGRRNGSRGSVPTTRVIRVDGAPPLVVGEIGPDDAPLINLVQHYDVQPAGDHSEWTTPPYAPEVRDGRLFARGATDNKGELLVRMWALDAWRRPASDCRAACASWWRARRRPVASTSTRCSTRIRSSVAPTRRWARAAGSTSRDARSSTAASAAS